jgi:sulfatase maturation enzyme AslB (radical SAM superfamily)
LGVDQRRGDSKNIVSRLPTFENPLRGERRSSMRTVFLGILLLSVLIGPLSVNAQNQPVTVEEVQQFINDYKDRYINLNYEGFMDLFSKEAVENRMHPYEDIREAYRETFDNSRAVQYNLEIYTIQVSQGSAFVSGRYELVQSMKGSKKSEVFRGDIQWELQRENGALKIKEINYGRDR